MRKFNFGNRPKKVRKCRNDDILNYPLKKNKKSFSVSYFTKNMKVSNGLEN